MIRYLIIVSGRVQDIGFRYFTQLISSELNLTGWCRNLSNGNVEIEIQGNEKSICHFIDSIQIGNGISNVKEMSISEINIIQNESTYKIIY